MLANTMISVKPMYDFEFLNHFNPGKTPERGIPEVFSITFLHTPSAEQTNKYSMYKWESD